MVMKKTTLMLMMRDARGDGHERRIRFHGHDHEGGATGQGRRDSMDNGIDHLIRHRQVRDLPERQHISCYSEKGLPGGRK
jgi:hypothetical protein